MVVDSLISFESFVTQVVPYLPLISSKISSNHLRSTKRVLQDVIRSSVTPRVEEVIKIVPSEIVERYPDSD
jgi:hypothetical protein